MWEWASQQVIRDYNEQGELLFSLMDTLTFWLQPEIKKNMQKQKDSAQIWPEASEYIEELRKMGASEDYIQKELKELQKEKNENVEEDTDTFVVLRGPKTEDNS